MKKNFFSIALSWLIGLGAFAQNLGSHLLFTAKLDGRQEVPAVTTTGRGIGTVLLNPTRDTLFVTLSWHSLTVPAADMHIHNGVRGVTGPIFIRLGNFRSGNRVVATITDRAFLAPASLARLFRGGWYFNIHTPTYPTGEIRGQIYLEKDKQLFSRLSNTQEPVLATPVTTGRGLGTFKLSRDSSTIRINVLAQGLTGPITSAHFHLGLPGQIGPVVKDLTSLIVGGNSLIGAVDSVATPPATTFIRDLFAGRIYINLHTAANPDGEQRGQVVLDTTNLLFDVAASAAQVVTPPSTNPRAKGTVLIRIAPTLDSLFVDGVIAGTPPLYGAYLQSGIAGQNGGVILDMTVGVRDSIISDTFSLSNPIYSTLVNNLLQGNIYFNVPTGANQTGELRGQVRRAARIGFNSALDGRQERPLATTSPAIGTAYASIDADFTLLHWAAMGNGFTSPLTGAHFHLGRFNEVGPVVYDLLPGFIKRDTVADGQGYIRDAAIPAPGISLAINAPRFLKDSIYINLHTITFPDGEIRGQMVKSLRSEVITGVKEVSATLAGSELAPNPTTGYIRMAVNSTVAGNGTITVIDMVGNELSNTPIQLTNGSNAFELNLESLTNGMYYVQIQNGGSKTVKKVVKY